MVYEFDCLLRRRCVVADIRNWSEKNTMPVHRISLQLQLCLRLVTTGRRPGYGVGNHVYAGRLRSPSPALGMLTPGLLINGIEVTTCIPSVGHGFQERSRGRCAVSAWQAALAGGARRGAMHTGVRLW